MCRKQLRLGSPIGSRLTSELFSKNYKALEPLPNGVLVVLAEITVSPNALKVVHLAIVNLGKQNVVFKKELVILGKNHWLQWNYLLDNIVHDFSNGNLILDKNSSNYKVSLIGKKFNKLVNKNNQLVSKLAEKF